MRRTVPSVLLVTGAVVMLVALPAAQAPTPAVAAADVTFTRDIAPIFSKSCWNCHNADAQLADLDLSTREAAIRGGEHGAAIVPGNAEQSKLYRMIAGLDSIQMPMDGDKLAPAEIAAIKAWIDRGAEWAASTAEAPKPAAANSALAALENMDISPEQRAYWAFKLPVQAALPAVKNVTHPIDRFLERARASKGLVAAPRADRRTLIRRAYLDLIGLPPTPAQVQAYLDDKSPEAWTRVIDALLASPHYGERWGRHWLDVARYAESSGKDVNLAYPHAWRYRDYVIAAFNAGKPYDEFIREQIAGDLLPAKDDQDRAENLVATGFLAIGAKSHNEMNPRQYYLDLADEQIDATSQAVRPAPAA